MEAHTAPSSAEIASIKDFVTSQRQELGTVQGEIKRMTLLLNDLRAKSHALKVSIKAHESLASPWLRVPPEIWLHIFLLARSEHAAERFEVWPYCSSIKPLEHVPWNIAIVCKQWREMVLAAPELWSFIDVCMDQEWKPEDDLGEVDDSEGSASGSASDSAHSQSDSDSEPIRSPAPIPDFPALQPSFYRKQMERSAAVGFDVVICECTMAANDDVDGVLHLISSHARSLRSFAASTLLVSQLRGSFPLLRNVALLPSHPRIKQPLSRLCQGAKQITHLHIIRDTDLVIFHPTSAPTPWSQLSSLKIDNLFCLKPAFFHLMDRLQGTIATLSIKMDFTFDEKSSIQFPSGSQFTMPHLISLTLAGKTEPCSKFMSCITASSLDTVSLRDLFPPDAPPELSDLIDRSKCTLTSLALHSNANFKAGKEQRPEFARKLFSDEKFYRNLRELDITGIVGSLDIDAVQWPSDPPQSSRTLYSNIQRLTLTKRSIIPERFFELIESARFHHHDGTGGALRYLKFDRVWVVVKGGLGSSGVKKFWEEPEVEVKLQHLKELGLEIEW